MSGVEVALERTADLLLRSSLEHGLLYPSSLAQQRFWVLDQLDPGNPSLNVAVRWRLEGVVRDVEIEHAFELILSRHEILRTSFVEADGEAVQNVQPYVPFHMP